MARAALNEHRPPPTQRDIMTGNCDTQSSWQPVCTRTLEYEAKVSEQRDIAIVCQMLCSRFVEP